ncbi:MAG: ABC transporter ATP-binding protein [Pseudomonadota bacterium]
MANICLTNVSRRFGNHDAVRDISFDVPSGAAFALLGPNGSGKSTLLRLMSGYLQPSAGDISIGGTSLIKHPQIVKRQLAYVPDQSDLYGHMRVRQFLRFMAAVREIDRAEQDDIIEEVINDLALQDVSNRRIDELSRGFRQRVAIAQALLNKPQVLLLDEPSNGLDLVQHRQWRELMKSLQARCTLIFSSHTIGDVLSIATSVGLLAHGRLLHVTKIEGQVSREAIEARFIETLEEAEAL